MNDRILGALQRAGIQDSLVASLDHDQQFFALTAQTLLYYGGEHAALGQVKLREISRIHSDHQGTLRVEAPGGTAITASLLGFDPNRVQRFFQTVRDTTARAKQLPSAPLPGQPEGGSKTFSPTPANPAPASPVPVAPALTPAPPLNLKPVNPSPIPAAPTISAPPIVIADSPAPDAPRVIKIGATQTSATQTSATQTSTPTASTPAISSAAPVRPELSKPEPVRAEPVRTEPVRIESGKPLSVSAPQNLNSPRPGEAPRASTPSAATPSAARPAIPNAAPTPSVQLPAGVAANPPAVPVPSTALERSLQSSSLIRAAQTVGNLTLTVRILSAVLLLGALGMGLVLWGQGRASQVPALWTVTMGIVTAVALNVLAEVLKLLAALGQTVAARD